MKLHAKKCYSPFSRRINNLYTLEFLTTVPARVSNLFFENGILDVHLCNLEIDRKYSRSIWFDVLRGVISSLRDTLYN